MMVAVGSTNPVKTEAARQAFGHAWPGASLDVEPVTVRSGVPEQPMSDLECIEGARNRAILAREALDAEYGVGLEAGLVHVGGLWFNCGWAVVTDATFREGIGSTFRVPVPTVVVRKVERGAELAEVMDEVLGENDARSAGYFGVLTGGAVTRLRASTDAVVAALAPFAHQALFDWLPRDNG
ncbi:MAG: inosine/xanthosine triphosphatase [Streptosporangiales bacterium]|nr:inosine/xanthosine triphosphatase [Streptosporangiales bacterium]